MARHRDHLQGAAGDQKFPQARTPAQHRARTAGARREDARAEYPAERQGVAQDRADVRQCQQGGALQQDRRGHRHARRAGEDPQGQCPQQDTEVLDALHTGEEGVRERRRRGGYDGHASRSDRRGAGRAPVRDGGVLQAHSGRQRGGLPRSGVGQDHRA